MRLLPKVREAVRGSSPRRCYLIRLRRPSPHGARLCRADAAHRYYRGPGRHSAHPRPSSASGQPRRPVGPVRDVGGAGRAADAPRWHTVARQLGPWAHMGWTCALERLGGQRSTAPTRASTCQFDLRDARWQHRGDTGSVYPRCTKAGLWGSCPTTGVILFTLQRDRLQRVAGGVVLNKGVVAAGALDLARLVEGGEVAVRVKLTRYRCVVLRGG